MSSSGVRRQGGGPYISIGVKVFTVAAIILVLMCAVTVLTVWSAAMSVTVVAFGPLLKGRRYEMEYEAPGWLLLAPVSLAGFFGALFLAIEPRRRWRRRREARA